MGTARSTKAAGRRLRKAKRAARPRRRGASAAAATEIALASFAHEVRTPLTGILALGELLAASDLPERERRWAGALKGAAEHLAQLTTLVVDGAKAASGTLELREERFRPRDLANTMAVALTARADAKGLATDVTIADDLPDVVTGDPVRLRAGIENLIDNAVKFTERGRVGFAVRANPAGRRRVRLTFSVADSGIGLAPAEIKRLFRPFAQAGSALVRRFAGAGLGLVFVRRMAKAMGGDVTVTSKPGRGSTFRLAIVLTTVDRAAPDEGGAAAPAGPAPEPSAGMRILCVEDNPYGRVILNTILTELGHPVDFAASGEAAVDALARGDYDLVLMDITLPGIDGFEATRRIRALDGAMARVPIVGISGRAGAANQNAARAAGMDFYLTKPVSPSRLAQIIATRA